MNLFHDAEQMQRIAEIHQERARLRTLARGSIVWGLINLTIGILALPDHIINFILVLIGLFLFLEGVWFSIRPSALGVLVDAVVMMVIGLWNIFIVALEILEGAAPRFYWAILGIVFIGFALYRLTTYPRLHLLFEEPIADEDLQHMDQLIRYLTKTKPKEASDLIAFRTRSSLRQDRQWRALLGPHYALFLDVLQKKVLTASHDDVSIEERGKVLIGSTLKVRIRIHDKRWDGLMPPVAFAKFQAWKLSDERKDGATTQTRPQPSTDLYMRRDQIQ